MLSLANPYECHLLKAKIHYTSFPVASPQQVGDFPVASPQQVRNINDKSLTSWRGQKSVVCVVLFPKFHYNDLLPTCCVLVVDLLAVSLTSP